MNIIKKLLFILTSLIISLSSATPIEDELLKIHKVTSTEMNNILAPQAGSLVYNTTENTLYFYTGTVWKRLRSIGSETIITSGSDINITGNGTSSVPYTIGAN